MTRENIKYWLYYYGMSKEFVDNCAEQIERDFKKALNIPEQPEIGLAEFTQKMDDWKARYNHPDNIPIKATMAFTARMFFMYPNVARQWYESLPKVTQD